MDYAEGEKNFDLADRIKHISPVSWKHVNFYGEYTFREIGNIIDLAQVINRLIALESGNYNRLV
jgi:fumarate reductase subunit C